MISLTSDALDIEVDDQYGADITRILVDGRNLLFETPWASRATAVRRSERHALQDGSKVAWLERYNGGWQVLAPNAGEPQTRDGASLGYHGESSILPWTVSDRSGSALSVRTALWTAPLEIERTISVVGSRVHVSDVITNVGAAEHSFDVLHHPALAGSFVDGGLIETGASAFVNDGAGGWDVLEPGSRHPWPHAMARDGVVHDLSRLPRGDEHRAVFGWLTGFADHWARVTAADGEASVLLEWDGTHLPHALFWQELGGSAGWPWFGRARTAAIEPASTPTSGPLAVPGIALGPGERVTIDAALTVKKGRT